MSKRNNKKEDMYDDEDNNFNDDNFDNEPNDDDFDKPDSEDDPLEYSRHEGNNESVDSKPTIDNFFDCEALLYSIEKTMKGFQKRNNEWVYSTTPKARDGFINTMVNALRSVINQQNMISRVDEEQAKFLLLEKNKEFIFRVYEEPSIEDEDIETVINVFDHALELFMGQVIHGFGARTFRQTSANVAYEVPEQKKDDSLINFGIGGSSILKMGGKR